MTKAEKIDQLLSQLEHIFMEAKKLELNKDTLESIDAACENLELDLREEVSNHSI